MSTPPHENLLATETTAAPPNVVKLWSYFPQGDDTKEEAGQNITLLIQFQFCNIQI